MKWKNESQEKGGKRIKLQESGNRSTRVWFYNLHFTLYLFNFKKLEKEHFEFEIWNNLASAFLCITENARNKFSNVFHSQNFKFIDRSSYFQKKIFTRCTRWRKFVYYWFIDQSESCILFHFTMTNLRHLITLEAINKNIVIILSLWCQFLAIFTELGELWFEEIRRSTSNWQKVRILVITHNKSVIREQWISTWILRMKTLSLRLKSWYMIMWVPFFIALCTRHVIRF